MGVSSLIKQLRRTGISKEKEGSMRGKKAHGRHSRSLAGRCAVLHTMTISVLCDQKSVVTPEVSLHSLLLCQTEEAEAMAFGGLWTRFIKPREQQAVEHGRPNGSEGLSGEYGARVADMK